MEIPVPLVAGIGTAIGALIAIILAIGKLAQKLGKIDQLVKDLAEHKAGCLKTRYDINARNARTNGKVDALMMMMSPGPPRAAAGARLPQPSPIDPPGPR